MTVINPCGFLQNAGATHTAEQMRNWFGAQGAGVQGSTSLVPRGGVHPSIGSELQVTQAGSPAMSVVVKSGAAMIPGTEGSKQGVYAVLNDADVTLTIAAAHASLNRIDRVCFKVEDSAYSGVANTSSLVVVTGTPAGSPVAPAAPANSITLATVSIVANDTSITNGEITDSRFYYAAVGGTITCTSTTRPAAGTVSDGQTIYETDTDRLQITHDGGTSWSLVSPTAALVVKATDETVNNNTTLQNDDELFLPVLANSTYHLELTAFYNSTTVADIKFNMALPAGAVMTWGGYAIDSTSGVLGPLANFQPAGAGGLGASNAVFVHQGRILTGGTAGTAQLQWAQGTAEATNTKVLGGSFMKLHRIG